MSAPEMSPKDFQRISQFIWQNWGLKMTPVKRTMLQGRLMKRLRILGLDTFSDYCEYLFSTEGQAAEVPHLADAVTTNKTEFFREPKALDHLAGQVLPELVAAREIGVRRRLNVWSAGCATGEEPYTLAMILNEFMVRYPGFRLDYLILATDLSTKALNTAKIAIYPEEAIETIPEDLRSKYLLRSRDRSRRLIRIIPELRAKVRFARLNLMEDFGFKEMMDIIFCRNVIIYFDQPTQEKLFDRFCRQLSPGGYIFIGHSETLHQMTFLPLATVAPCVYQKVR